MNAATGFCGEARGRRDGYFVDTNTGAGGEGIPCVLGCGRFVYLSRAEKKRVPVGGGYISGVSRQEDRDPTRWLGQQSSFDT